ncbi:MAG: hypothetical protein WAR79_18550 [Melioribacteraceae bacterium]
MKIHKMFLLLIVVITILISNRAEAQERTYTEGTVWDISLIKTKSPYFNDYMNNLNIGWRKVMDEAKNEGIILSYMVLSQNPQNPGDWDLALLIEYKNMAALDGLRDKMEKIQSKLFGGRQTIQDAAVKRNELREMLGNRLTRQLIFK